MSAYSNYLPSCFLPSVFPGLSNPWAEFTTCGPLAVEGLFQGPDPWHITGGPGRPGADLPTSLAWGFHPLDRYSAQVLHVFVLDAHAKRKVGGGGNNWLKSGCQKSTSIPLPYSFPFCFFIAFWKLLVYDFKTRPALKGKGRIGKTGLALSSTWNGFVVSFSSNGPNLDNRETLQKCYTALTKCIHVCNNIIYNIFEQMPAIQAGPVLFLMNHIEIP